MGNKNNRKLAKSVQALLKRHNIKTERKDDILVFETEDGEDVREIIKRVKSIAEESKHER